MKKIKTIISIILGFGILLFILWKIGFQDILDLLVKVNIYFFILAAIVYLINEVLASLILKIATSTDIRLRHIVPAHMCGMLYSNLTPGRVGYYYTAFSLSRKLRNSIFRNVGILTAIQGISLALKAFLCFISIIYFSGFIDPYSFIYVIPLLIIIVLLIFIILYTEFPQMILIRFPVLKNIIDYVSLMQESCRKLERRRIVRIISLYLIGWFLMALQWFLLSISLGIRSDFLTYLMLQPLLTAVMFIPLTPGGLGITESASGLLFGLIGLTHADGVVFMLLVRVNSIIVDSLGIVDMGLFRGVKMINERTIKI